MGFKLKNCSFCAVELTDSDEEKREGILDTDWLLVITTHNKKTAGLCKLCYMEVAESIIDKE